MLPLNEDINAVKKSYLLEVEGSETVDIKKAKQLA